MKKKYPEEKDWGGETLRQTLRAREINREIRIDRERERVRDR